MDESMKLGGLVSREKYWKELTPEEKVERMRQTVKQQRSEIAFLRSQLDSLQDHVHVGDRIYSPRGHLGYGGVSTGGPRRIEKDDEVFF